MHRHLGLCPRLRRGNLSVPDDIGLAGFGNFELSRFSSPTISTVVVDPKGIGREAGRLIERLLTSKSPALGIPLGCECGARIARKHQKR